jgi:predicted phosphoribosyltransferase
MNMLFRNRNDAGRQLAQRLLSYSGRPDVIVLALPRGGVPIGYEVARLDVPLTCSSCENLVYRVMPSSPWAIASGGVRVVNDHVVRMLGIGHNEFEAVAAREGKELPPRRTLPGNRPIPMFKTRQ